MDECQYIFDVNEKLIATPCGPLQVVVCAPRNVWHCHKQRGKSRDTRNLSSATGVATVAVVADRARENVKSNSTQPVLGIQLVANCRNIATVAPVRRNSVPAKLRNRVDTDSHSSGGRSRRRKCSRDGFARELLKDSPHSHGDQARREQARAPSKRSEFGCCCIQVI